MLQYLQTHGKSRVQVSNNMDYTSHILIADWINHLMVFSWFIFGVLMETG